MRFYFSGRKSKETFKKKEKKFKEKKKKLKSH